MRWRARQPRRLGTEPSVLSLSHRPATASRSQNRVAASEPGPHRLRIAVPSLDDEFWTVGPIHMNGLLSAVRDTYAQQIGLFSFSSTMTDDICGQTPAAELDGVIRYTYAPRWSVAWAENWLSRHVRTRDVSVQRTLERYGIDAVLCTGLSSGYGRIATLWWLPDLQHLRLPEMFDGADRAARNSRFTRSSEVATRILVMSHSVRLDFQAFAPKYAAKVRLVPPASYIADDVYQKDPLTVTRLYNLPDKFVYLPNQFWKHKNHELVIRAVAVLKRRGIQVCVVCTGNLIDYRHPRQSSELFHKLSVWDVREQVIYLGMLVRDEVLALMRQSVGVLNPSLFEGWGYTVDEARSLGKSVLLSDIPAHREQNPPNATYFDPFDCEDLATKLAEAWERNPGPDLAVEADARLRLQQRRRTYAEQFVAIAEEAVAEVRA